MDKIAFMFPGQGAQYIGMAKDFYEKEAAAEEIFQRRARLQESISLRFALKRKINWILRNIHRLPW